MFPFSPMVIMQQIVHKFDAGFQQVRIVHFFSFFNFHSIVGKHQQKSVGVCV